MAWAWRPADRCGDDEGGDQADDVERGASGCRAQPQSLLKRRVAEQGGKAGGGSTLRTQSAFAQMGHIDSPGRIRLSRDIHFEKSPTFRVRLTPWQPMVEAGY